QNRGVRARAISGNCGAQWRRRRCGDGSDHSDAAGGDDSAGASDVARDKSGRGRAGGLESSGRKNRCGFRFHLSTRPLLWSRCFAINRYSDRRLRLQIVDNSESAARFFAGGTLPVACHENRGGTFSDYAGEGNFHSWSRPCPPQNNRAWKPGRITGENDRSKRGRIERARMESFAGTETGIRARRTSTDAVGVARE